MSHWTTIKTQIRDIPALRAAVAELGLTLEQDAEARGYQGNRTKGQFVIKCKGAYDVALNLNKDGSYDLNTDWYEYDDGRNHYGGTVRKELGENFSRLVQLYGVHRATLAARQRGHQVTRSTGNNGQIRLVITGASL